MIDVNEQELPPEPGEGEPSLSMRLYDAYWTAYLGVSDGHDDFNDIPELVKCAWDAVAVTALRELKRDAVFSLERDPLPPLPTVPDPPTGFRVESNLVATEREAVIDLLPHGGPVHDPEDVELLIDSWWQAVNAAMESAGWAFKDSQGDDEGAEWSSYGPSAEVSQ